MSTAPTEPTGLAAAMAPSLEDLEALAVASYAALPDDFRKLTGDIQFRVAEFPEEDVLDDLGVESEFDILGLFQGDRPGA